MSADALAYTLVALGVLPATGIVAVLALRRAWHRTWLGRALMLQSVGLACLIDISLLYKVFGDDYPGRDLVRLSVYAAIILGEWGLFMVLLTSRRRELSR